MAKKSDKNKGMHPQYHYGYNREFVDYDYIEKLSEEEAEWLANFSDNYYGGRFKSDDSKNPIKTVEERRKQYNAASRRRFDFTSGRPKSRVMLRNADIEGMEITDLGVAIETRTGKRVGDDGSSDE
jgi:hypothetical protein